ncbi:hypothetical protein PORY_002559 [Pneumocystis oryctolagi]|uniref:Uncharacterized protein n=1 Tax=Pneumocystis oryctolagi TaxID=42067 RepID=A0ACB7C8Q8_9ASCO|nr:hypothetical protein PORY_002559 [Pneumocystis oryctolagi]
MEDRLEQALPETLPHVSAENVMNCTFSAWRAYCRAITPNARVIRPLDKAFLRYLDQDGLVLPPIDSQYDEDAEKDVESVHSEDIDENILDNSSTQDSSLVDCTVAFRSLDEEITRTISILGGAVFPKLSWSAPKDAAWITSTRTLRCTTASDIYLLLKSSDCIAHDLHHAFDDCSPSDIPSHFEHELVLKQWFNLLPSMEFRCFVKQRRLIGISQRDLKYYAFLEPLRSTIRSLSIELFNLYLKDKFPDENFVFDIYIPPSKTKAWLIDINLWHCKTSSLLFSWKELLDDTLRFNDDNDSLPQLRLVDMDSSPWGPSQFTTQRIPDDFQVNIQDFEEYIEKLDITTDATNKRP